MSLPVIEIQESQKMRKEITLYPKEERKKKLRLTNMNYRTNKGRERGKMQKGRTQKDPRGKRAGSRSRSFS